MKRGSMHNMSHPPMGHWRGAGARWGLVLGALVGILLGGGVVIGLGITLGGTRIRGWSTRRPPPAPMTIEASPQQRDV